MRFTVQNNIEAHNKALADFARFKRWEISRALRYEARQLAVLLIKLTPPQNRKQGRDAVARDIKRAILPLRAEDFSNPYVREVMRVLIRKRNYERIKGYFETFQSGRLRNAEVVPFDSQRHVSVRNRRGRVEKNKNVVTPDASEVRDYIKKVQSRVGRGKGGWAESAIRLGAKPASWIATHRETGSFRDNADSAVNAYIDMINESEWASRGDDDRVVSNALRSRATAIRTNIAKSVEKAAQKAKLK